MQWRWQYFSSHKKAPQVEEKLVRDENTNELFMTLSLHESPQTGKKEMLYVPLDFENALTLVALSDSGAYVNAIAENYLDKINQQAPAIFFNIDDRPIFRIQVANAHLGKPKATSTLNFDIEIASLQNTSSH